MVIKAIIMVIHERYGGGFGIEDLSYVMDQIFKFGSD